MTAVFARVYRALLSFEPDRLPVFRRKAVVGQVFVALRTSDVALVSSLAGLAVVFLVVPMVVAFSVPVVAALAVLVQLLKRLLPHRFDLLLVIQPICHFEGDLLLLLHRCRQLIVCLGSIFGHGLAHFVEGLEVAVRVWLLHGVGTDRVDIARTNRVILVLVQDGSDTFLAFSDVADFSRVCIGHALLAGSVRHVEAEALLVDKFAVAALGHSCGYGRHLELRRAL